MSYARQELGAANVATDDALARAGQSTTPVSATSSGGVPMIAVVGALGLVGFLAYRHFKKGTHR